MTEKTLEKKTVWQEIKDAIKIGLPVALLTSPIITNVGSYLHTQHEINDRKTPEAKEIIAGIHKDSYQDGNFVKKTCFLGEYIAANKYLKNSK